MAHDLITTLRRHDPAAALRPLPEAEAGAMRAAILCSPATAGNRRRRWPIAAAIAAAALLAGGATVYSSISTDDSAPTVRRQYTAVKRTIDLPAGSHWQPIDAPRELALRQALRARSSRSARRSARGTATGWARRRRATTLRWRGHTPRPCGCGG